MHTILIYNSQYAYGTHIKNYAALKWWIKQFIGWAVC